MADDGHATDGESIPLIEQAKGILMARHGIGPAAAATRLRIAAKYARRPLEEIAGDLIADLLRRGRPVGTPSLHPAPHAAPAAAPGPTGGRPHRSTGRPTMPAGLRAAR